MCVHTHIYRSMPSNFFLSSLSDKSVFQRNAERSLQNVISQTIQLEYGT